MNQDFNLKNFTSKFKLINSLIKEKKNKIKNICMQLNIYNKKETKKKNLLIEDIINKYIVDIENKELPKPKINIKLPKNQVCLKKGKRKYMEDTYVYSEYDDIKLFGVFDGHSGKKISNLLPEYISKIFFYRLNYAIRYNPKKVKKMIKETFLDIDNFINSQFPNIDSGSTACLCLNIKDKYYMINLGDSRGLLICVNQNKFTTLVTTKDHKPEIYEEFQYIEQHGGNVEKEEGDVHRVNGNLAMSRAFGDFDLKYNNGGGFKGPVSVKPDITVKHKKKCNGEILLILATDGLWDVFTEDEVLDFFANNEEDLFCQKIVNHAIKIGSKDNISIIKKWL